MFHSGSFFPRKVTTYNTLSITITLAFKFEGWTLIYPTYSNNKHLIIPITSIQQ